MLKAQRTSRPPMNYKLLEFGLPGKIAGSAQPGGHIHPETVLQLILELKTEVKPNNPKIPARVTSNLDYLHNNKITAIYNLTPNPSALIKYLWETEYTGTYITEINAVSIAIENCQPPTSEQLLLIVDDAIARMSKGENILFHCEGGLGRTGTILAAIYMKVEKDSTGEDAIKFIRENYAKHAIDTSQENSLRSLGLSNSDLKMEVINPDEVKSILKSEVSSLALLDDRILRQPEANLESEDILESFLSNLETRKIWNLEGVKEFGYESQETLRSNPALQVVPGNQNVVGAALNDTSSANSLDSKVSSLLGSGNVKNLPKILRNDKVSPDGQNILQTNDCCVVSYLTVLNNDNPLLNYPELVREAIKTKQFSNLLELGLDQGVAYCIIEATKQYGAEHVMNILFAKIKKPADKDILLAIQTIENAFGKPELEEIGFYDYTTRLNSNTIKIVQAISEWLVNLQKLLLDEIQNKANLLTVNLLVLEDLFQLVAIGTKIYMSAPIYPNVEPDGNPNNNGFYDEIRDTWQNTTDISDSLLSYMGNSTANNDS